MRHRRGGGAWSTGNGLWRTHLFLLLLLRLHHVQEAHGINLLTILELGPNLLPIKLAHNLFVLSLQPLSLFRGGNYVREKARELREPELTAVKNRIDD